MVDCSKSVAEKLRGKHVRTLELLEKVVNERNALLQRVEDLEKLNLVVKPEVNGPSLEPDSLVQELKEKVTSTEKALRAVEAQLKGKLTASFRNVAEKEARIEALKGENEKLLAMTLDTSQINVLKEELKTLASSLEAEKNNSRRLLEEAEGVHTQHEKDLVALVLEKKEGSMTRNALEAHVETLKQTNRELENEVAQTRIDVSVGNQERSELRRQLERLSQEMLSSVDISPQLAGMAKELGRVQAENEALNSEVERLVKLEKTLKQQLVQLQKQSNSSAAGKSQFAAHISLKKENQLLKMQLDDMRAINRKFVGKPVKNNVSMSSLNGSGGRR